MRSSSDIKLISVNSYSKSVYSIKKSAFQDLVEFDSDAPSSLVMKRTKNYDTVVEANIVNGLSSLTFESIYSRGINDLSMRLYGKRLVAKEYAPIRESISRVNNLEFRHEGGYSFHEYVEGSTFLDFRTSLGSRIANLRTDAERQVYRTFIQNLLSKLPKKEAELQNVFKRAGYEWRDYKSDNIMMLFKNSAGQKVSLDEILQSSELASIVEPEFVIIDLGGTKIVPIGSGRAYLMGRPDPAPTAYEALIRTLNNFEI